MRDGMPREIRKAPDRQEHQPNEKKGGESHHDINHFPFRDKVHEIARDERCLSDRNCQCDRDVDGANSKGDIRSGHRNQRSKKQGVKDEQVTPDVMAKVIV
jgi:hypothetical protein